MTGDPGNPGYEGEKESIKYKKYIQGAIGPLLGDVGGSVMDHPSDDTGAEPTSKALVGVPEKSGGGAPGKRQL